jgi:DNA ligase-1
MVTMTDKLEKEIEKECELHAKTTSNMEVSYQSPAMLKTDSKGGVRIWCGFSMEDPASCFYTMTVYGQLIDGQVGSLVTTQPKRIYGKNIGRSNETSPSEQAFSEIVATAQAKQAQGYSNCGQIQISGLKTITRPMLAKTFEKNSKKVIYPCHVQPKLDGVRALYVTEGGSFFSRLGKVFIHECTEHLIMKELRGSNVLLDGELILPAPYTFQDTIRAIKKFRSELSPLLEFHVFDVVLDEPWEDRKVTLEGLLAKVASPKIIEVPTDTVKSEADMRKKMDEYIALGHEGIIIRNLKGKYKVAGRSSDLLKHKLFKDEEFKIVDVIEGEGNETGLAVFICEMPDGQTFTARPKGESSYRAKLFLDKDNLIGKLLTVKYQNLTDGGVPRFPVGIGVRDYES